MDAGVAENVQPFGLFVDKIEDLIFTGKGRMTGIFLSVFFIQHTISSGVFAGL